MRELPFEYTDVKFTFRLLGVCFLLFVALLMMMVLFEELFAMIGMLVLAIGAPVAMFMLLRNRIKKQGIAFVYEDSTELRLDDSSESISYFDIVSFRIERYNGTQLLVQLRNNRSFRMQANSYFCDAEAFDGFCEIFENTVQAYKAANDRAITWKKTLFEQPWMLPVLILLSVILVGGLLYVMVVLERRHPVYLVSLVPLVPLWIVYRMARKRAHEKELI